jgi:tRNA (guanine37-N1)-methyltransferase
MRVPEVLLSGHHARIAEARRKDALERTLRRRPDLLEDAELSKKEEAWLRSLGWVGRNRSPQSGADQD